MITPNDYFDEIFCLNLSRRNDKWKQVQHRFRRENIFVKRIEGVDGKKLKREYYHKKIYDPDFKIKTVGAFGILHSFINIFEHIINNDKIKRVLIFEDDVVFYQKFAERFHHSVRNIPKNWDVWYLGASQYMNINSSIHNIENDFFQKNIKILENNLFYYANKTDGFFAIALTRDFIKEFYPFQLQKKLPSDSLLQTKFQKDNKYLTIVSYPFLCFHDYGYSDNWNFNIGQNEVEQKWFHRKFNKNIFY